MATTHIHITRISSETVVAGSTLTFHGENMAADHIAHFKHKDGGEVTRAHGESGGHDRVHVTVPHTLVEGHYHVHLTDFMGGAMSAVADVAVRTTGMGSGAAPAMAVVSDTTAMGSGHTTATATAGSVETE